MKKDNGLIIFIISVFCCLFWITAQVIDMYAVKIAGILFELLSLPTLIAGFVLFLISIVKWVKEKCRLNSFYLKIICLYLLTILIIVLIQVR
jgi:hypothetical protein